MRLIKIAAIAAFALADLSVASQAQHAGHGQQHQRSPYADIASRPIKALTDEQLADLKAGRGMGFSLPAELNNYPGPKHVLELADQLSLSNGQRLTTERLISSMTQEAVTVGTELIALETQLEALFVNRTASEARVSELVAQIGGAQARLRTIHLKYHLTMTATLTTQQVTQYASLRGYQTSK